MNMHTSVKYDDPGSEGDENLSADYNTEEEIGFSFHMEKCIEDPDCTLILPAISEGNVAQLAMDLLIETMKPKKVGYIFHPAIREVVGDCPYSSEDPEPHPVSSAEVYHDSKHHLFMFQFRAPMIRQELEHFLEDVIKFCKSMLISNVVILASSSVTERVESQLEGEPFQYLATPNLHEKYGEVFCSRWPKYCDLEWIPLDKRVAQPGLINGPYDIEAKCVIPGGGLTRLLYQMCHKEGIPCSVLVTFVSLGDSRPNAHFLATKANDWLHIVHDPLRNMTEKRIWTAPPSWNKFFGSGPPLEIF